MSITQLEPGKQRLIIDDFRGGINTNSDPTKMSEEHFQELKNIDYAHDYEGSALGRKSYIPIQYNTHNPMSTFPYSFTTLIALYWKKFKKVLSTDPTYYFYVIHNAKKIKIYKEAIDSAVTELTLAFNVAKTNALNFYNNLYIVDTAIRDYNTLSSACNPNIVIGAESFGEQGCPPCPQTFNISESSITRANFYISYTRQYAITFLYDNNQESYIIPVNNNVNGTYISRAKDMQTSTGNDNIHTSHIAPWWKPSLRARNTNTTNTKYNLLTNIPIGNARVKARKIYARDVDGTAETYLYLIGILDNNIDTVFLDNIDRSNKGVAFNLEFVWRPPNAKYITSHKESLVMANTHDRQYTKESAITNIELSLVEYGLTSQYNSEIAFCPTMTVDGAEISTSTGSMFARGPLYRYLFRDYFPIINAKENYLNGFVSEFKGTDYYEREFDKTQIDPDTREVFTSQHLMIKLDYTMSNLWSKKAAVFRNICMFIRGFEILGGDILRLPYGYAYYNTATDTYVWYVGCKEVFNETEHVIISSYNTPDLQKVEVPIVGSGTYSGGPYNEMPYIDISYGDIYNFAPGDCILSKKLYFQGITAQEAVVYFDKLSEQTLFDITNDFESKNICEASNEARPYMSITSEVGKGDIFLPENERPIGYTDNQEILALTPEDNAILYFKQNSIWHLNTNSVSKDYWVLTMLTDSYGLQNDRALAVINNSQYIFWYQGICYHWFALNAQPVPCSDRIINLLPANFDVIDSYYDSKNNRVMFFGNDSCIYIYDMKFRTETGLGKWYFHKNDTMIFPFTKGVSGPQKESYFLGGKEIYKYDNYTIGQDFLWQDDGGGT
jgi:hypothetical protein